MDEYLEHHGIKGQKWGVRRFQNEDGSLTAAGRRRAAKEYDYKKSDKYANATSAEKRKQTNLYDYYKRVGGNKVANKTMYKINEENMPVKKASRQAKGKAYANTLLFSLGVLTVADIAKNGKNGAVFQTGKYFVDTVKNDIEINNLVTGMAASRASAPTVDGGVKGVGLGIKAAMNGRKVRKALQKKMGI